MKNKILSACIIGSTNSGKSTFFNYLIKKNISIVNKKRNTTIDSIKGIVNINNLQIIFYDTPGINFFKVSKDSQHIIKNIYWNSIFISDIILYLIDVSKKNIIINHDIIKIIRRENKNKKIVFILNKIDLVKKIKLLPIIDKINNIYDQKLIIPISAKLGQGIDIIINILKNNACKGEWLYKKNIISDKNNVYISNEVTRNSLLKNLNQEIPYALNVTNTKWKIINNNNIIIKQNIIANKKAYKKIILGKDGHMIKRIRESSQKELSKLFNKKIHLYINIKFQ